MLKRNNNNNKFKKNNKVNKVFKNKRIGTKKELCSIDYFKKNNIGLTVNGSASAKNTLLVNRLKNIDYTEYFKINNQKSENNIKNNNNNNNYFTKYTIQPKNYFTHKTSPKKISNNINKHSLHKKFCFDFDSNSIKNTENAIFNAAELNSLFINKNIYNTFYNTHNNLYTEQSIDSITNKADNDIDEYNIKKVYNNTGEIINNDINNNVNKIKKEEELSRLKDTLKKLNLKNKEIQTELNMLQNKNIKIKNNQNENKMNKLLYLDIKNILKNNINNNDSQMDISDLLEYYKFKFDSASFSLKENIEYLRKAYLDEKLKNSLIEKGYTLFLKKDIIDNGNDDNDIEIKTDEYSVSDINTDDFWKNLIKIIGDIDKMKKFNEELQINVDNENEEKNLYSIYYNKWTNLFGVNNKEDLKNKIVDLINDQNYNDIEEVKLYKILMNK